jgi:cbb3-type cytochrome oxidase subunit 1
MGVLCLLMAAFYLCLGLILGLAMAANHDFQLRSVHAHINLLGWASLGIIGLIYIVLPELTHGRLAVAHMWLHGLGLPVMMGGLAALALGNEAIEPLVVAGSLAVTLGLFCFTAALFRNARN